MNRSITAILLVALLGASSIAVGYAYTAELTMETVIESGGAEYCTVSMSPDEVAIGPDSGTIHWISFDGHETPYSLKYTDAGVRNGVVNMTISFDDVSVSGSAPVLNVLVKDSGSNTISGSVALVKGEDNIVSGSFVICGLGELVSGTGYDVYLSIVTSDVGTATINVGGSITIAVDAYALGVSS